MGAALTSAIRGKLTSESPSSPGTQARHDERHLPVWLARPVDADLRVVPERRQEIHQSLYREVPRPVAHQQRHMGLLDAQNLTSLHLRQVARLDVAVDLQVSGP